MKKTPESALKADLEILEQYPFKRHRMCAPLLAEVHRLLALPEFARYRRDLYLLRAWLMTPYSLWPIDFKGFGEHIVRQVCEVKQLDDKFLAILDKLQTLPADTAQAIVLANEKAIARGEYEMFLTKSAQTKFNLANEELLSNPEWLADFADFSSRWDLDKYRSKESGMLRRTLLQERNFRPDGWEFDGTNPDNLEDELFYTEFDALCEKWCLFGLQHETALLLKPTVHPTAYGVMIIIPAYWSLDYKRDLNWKAIRKLLQAGSPLRQGPAMSEYRIRRNEVARLVYLGTKKADELELIGDARQDFITHHAGIGKSTDPRILNRLADVGEVLVKSGPFQVKAKQTALAPKRRGRRKQ